jgi:hypothetical protein
MVRSQLLSQRYSAAPADSVASPPTKTTPNMPHFPNNPASRFIKGLLLVLYRGWKPTTGHCRQFSGTLGAPQCPAFFHDPDRPWFAARGTGFRARFCSSATRGNPNVTPAPNLTFPNPTPTPVSVSRPSRIVDTCVTLRQAQGERRLEHKRLKQVPFDTDSCYGPV